MNKYLKIIFQVGVVLALIFMIVFSKIQIGYAEKEKQKATELKKLVTEIRGRAEQNAVLAQKSNEEAWSKVEELAKELESCKNSKK